MTASWKSRLLRLLRVPPEPAWATPSTNVRVFRAAPAYFRYRLLRWALKQLGAVVGLVFGFLLAGGFIGWIDDPRVRLIIVIAEVVAWTAFLIQIPISYAVLKLDFEMRWYLLSDRSLRIREGVLRLREKTMTFANIQQITIRQNPLQRLLGIADVKVRTAGGGSGGRDGHFGESMHEAHFRGVDDADAIRHAIRERVRLYRDSGLGDTDESHRAVVPARPAAEPVVAAARELSEEIRELSAALATAAPPSADRSAGT